MVQRKVALVPTGTPLTAEVAEPGLAIVAVPLITVQVPVPEVGTFPARVKVPVPQEVWSNPALAIEGGVTIVTTVLTVDEQLLTSVTVTV